MSQKITSKNLAYDSSLPPFLAALRAQASGASGPDPILAAQRRPGKKRSGSEDAEDIPLVVDEHGNTIDLRVDKDGTVQESAAEEVEDAVAAKDGNKDDTADKLETGAKSAIGGRKRKVGKVVGDAALEPSDKDEKPDPGVKDDKESDAPASKKVKKKAKKIKLSFDDEEP